MKRISYALALCLGLMMNACGSSGSSTPAAATCTNQYGQVVTGTLNAQGICQATSGTCGQCTQPNGMIGVTNPQNPAQCMPPQYATSLCGQGGYGTTGYGTTGYGYGTTGYGYGTTGYGGYGTTGYGYPYSGYGYGNTGYGHGCGYQYGQYVCW